MQATAMWASAYPEECAIYDECATCAGRHDEEIHDATVSIHQWLRLEVQRWIEPEQFKPTATVESVAATIL